MYKIDQYEQIKNFKNADLHKNTDDLSSIYCDITDPNSIANTIDLVISKYKKTV